MTNGKETYLDDAAAGERQALLAVVLVVTAVAGLVLLWPADWEGRVTGEIGSGVSEEDAARVQTLMRAF